jgi:hypothetical protein
VTVWLSEAAKSPTKRTVLADRSFIGTHASCPVLSMGWQSLDMSEQLPFVRSEPQARTDVDIARTAAKCGLVLFGVIFLVMWGPVYIANYWGLVLLFPIFFVVGATAGILGLIAAVFSTISLRRTGEGGGALVIGLGLVFVAPIALWLGNYPLTLFGITGP